MLENSLIESRTSAPTRKPLTLVLSTVVHVVIVGMLLVLPLIQTQAVPRIDATFLLRPPEQSLPEAPEEPTGTAPAIQPDIVPSPDEFVAPTTIPSEIVIVFDEPVDITPVVRRNVGVNTLLDSIVRQNAEIPEAVPPPPPPAVPDSPAPKILRVSGGLQNGKLIHQPKPTYPPIARTARVQGVVLLEAVIGEEGAIESLRVISGHPLLATAAIEAVRQWRYHPTLLSGEPIQVITTITVNFSLQ